MPSISLPDGTSFEAQPGENLLQAAQRAHWLVRYGCRNGNCEACAATLHSGRVRQGEAIIDAAAGAQPILLCLCSAESDLRIDLPGNPLHGSEAQARRSYARVLEGDGAQLRFALPAGRRPPVYPGQYLLIETESGAVRADIDVNASSGRELCTCGAALPLRAGDYAWLRYPLGYCYVSAAPSAALILFDAQRAQQARQLRAALPRADIAEVAAADAIAPHRNHYDTVLACAGSEDSARRWYESLLARHCAFGEFRCDTAIWQRWRVQRQDDNGNRFSVASNCTEEAARALAAQMESRGHKQLYWAEPVPRS